MANERESASILSAMAFDRFRIALNTEDISKLYYTVRRVYKTKLLGIFLRAYISKMLIMIIFSKAIVGGGPKHMRLMLTNKNALQK